MNKTDDKFYQDVKTMGRSLPEMIDAKAFLEERLGGNMNIATLTPFFWNETMVDYAKHYHKNKLGEGREI